MAVYFPLFEDVYVYRNRVNPEQSVTLVLRGREHLHQDPPPVIIDGVSYDYDEHNTERTRMFMRVNATKRREAEGIED